MKRHSAALLLIIMISLSACGKPEEQTTAPQAEIAQVIQLAPQEITEQRRVIAQIAAKSNSIVRAKAAGRVQSWNKNVGDQINNGEAVIALGSDLSLETQRDLNVALLDLNAAQQNKQLIESQNLSNTKLAQSNLQNAKDRMELAKRNMNEVLASIKNKREDLDRNITLTTQKSANKKAEIITDVSKFINEDDLLNGEYESLREQSERYAFDQMRSANDMLDRVTRSQATIGKQNAELLKAAIGEFQDLSVLLSGVIISLNRTIPSDSDTDTHSTLTSLYNTYQLDVDTELVSLSSLLDTWNTTNTNNVSTQENAYLEVQQSERAFTQAQKDYSAALEANKYSNKTADLQIQQASYGVQTAQRNAESLNGKAPLSGKLVKKFKTVGDEVSVGDSLYEIVDPNGMELITFISEDIIDLVSTETEITLDGVNYPVTEVASVSSGVGNKYEVRIAINSEGNKIGQYKTITFNIKQPEALWVPLSAIDNRDNKNFIYTINADNSLTKKEVQVLKFAGNQIQIKQEEGLTNTEILRFAKGVAPNTIINRK